MVERKNRHLVENGLTLLAHSCVPFKFWHFAFDMTVFLINRMPSSVSKNKSPYKCIFNQPPDYSFLKVFKCLCYPLIRLYNRYKVDYRYTTCLFFGYSSSHMGYRCLNLKTNHFYITRHALFNEDYYLFSNTVCHPDTNLQPMIPSHPWVFISPVSSSASAQSRQFEPQSKQSDE